jgi:hypothetical protein
MTSDAGAAPPTKEPQSRSEPVRHSGDAQRTRPRRRQLDRQRHPVQPAADLSDGVQLVRVRVVGATLRPDPLDEQRDRVAHVVLADRRDRQRSERHHLLTADHQRLAARGHHRDSRRCMQQPLDELRHTAHHVLAVVEHEHRGSWLEVLDQPVLDRLARRCAHTQRGGDLIADRPFGADQSEIDEPHPGPDHAPVARFDHQPGLAHPADTDDRDQPAPVDHL